MKKRIAITTVLIALGALALAPMVAAHPHRGMRGAGQGSGAGAPAFERRGPGFGILGRLGRMRAELGMTDEQSARIRTIFAEAHEQNVRYREQMRGGRRAIADTLLADPGNVTAAQALIDEQTAAERALKTNLLQATSKALAVLNAEQRAKLSTMLEERADRAARRGRRR